MHRRLIVQGAWLWIVLSGATVSAAVFAVWEVIQQNYFQDLDYPTLHYLYITRGIALAFFLAAWAACIVVPPPPFHDAAASIQNEIPPTDRGSA